MKKERFCDTIILEFEKRSNSMKFESYLNLLNMQHKSMTKEQIEAIVQKNRLHKIACEKMQVRDQLEMQYRDLFVKGFQKLSST